MRLEMPIACTNTGNNWVIHFVDGTDLVIEASGDPKISITCMESAGGPNYNCNGDMQ